MGIPVVEIRGILESGKTKFIIDSLKNGDFGDLGRTLILSQEEGVEEYDAEELKKYKASFVIVENKEDWNEKFINEQIKKYRPQVIFVEANEMWEFDNLIMPVYFDVQQVMTIIDGTTFGTYFNNMRQKFSDMIKVSDIVIINRCKPTEETSQFKRNVKLINRACTVISLDEKGEALNLESDLPYSLKDDVIKISFDDFSVFYIDTFENKNRYDIKTVEFDCMAVFDRKLPPKTFVAGRFAMTCCADDIQFIGHLCSYNQDLQIENKSWVRIKAVVHYMRFRGAPEEQIVLEALEIAPIDSPPNDKVVLSLV